MKAETGTSSSRENKSKRTNLHSTGTMDERAMTKGYQIRPQHGESRAPFRGWSCAGGCPCLALFHPRLAPSSSQHWRHGPLAELAIGTAVHRKRQLGVLQCTTPASSHIPPTTITIDALIDLDDGTSCHIVMGSNESMRGQ